MENVKAAFESKAVISGLVAAVLSVLSLTGITVSSGDAAILVNSISGLFTLLTALGTTISVLYGVYRRVKATERIGGWFTADPAKAPGVRSTILRP